MSPVITDLFKIQIGVKQIVAVNIVPVLGHGRSGKRDETVAGKDQVGGGFVRACAGIEIGAESARGLLKDKVASVIALEDGLVAGREVENDFRARHREQGTGRKRRPEVLADFHAHFCAVGRGEDQVRAERKGKRAERDPAEAVRCGGKPAAFVIFAVGRKKGLGYGAENVAARKKEGTVIKPAVLFQRCADSHQNIFRNIGGQLAKRLSRAFQQKPGSKQVAAGIAGQ